MRHRHAPALFIAAALTLCIVGILNAQSKTVYPLRFPPGDTTAPDKPPSKLPSGPTRVDPQPSWSPELLWGQKQRSEEVSFTPTADDLKRMPDVLPAKIAIINAADSVRGTIYLSAHPSVDYAGASFRPSGKTESKEVKFLLLKSDPQSLPTAGVKVAFRTDGNYLALPSHAVYAIFGLALKKNDSDVANALERLLGRMKSKGTTVYSWSAKKLEFILYDEPAARQVEYKGTVTITENVTELSERINALVATYYWMTAAKFAATPNDRDQLKALAAIVLPRETVDQWVQSK